jgi:hypothetical protein
MLRDYEPTALKFTNYTHSRFSWKKTINLAIFAINRKYQT